MEIAVAAEVGKSIDSRVAAFRADPSLVAEHPPDPWQRDLLRSAGSGRDLLLLTSRQAGKSQACADLGLATVLTVPRALVVIVSPSQRQSGETYKKLRDNYNRLGRPIAAVKLTETELTLVNGSRVVSLPDSPDTIVGFSAVHTLIIDEAARVSSDLFTAVSPMRAVTRGRLILVSSAKGKAGYFYEEWTAGGPTWERVMVTADQCPRITAEYLDGERRRMGEAMFMREYYCVFTADDLQYFPTEAVEGAFRDDLEPLFGEDEPT